MNKYSEAEYHNIVDYRSNKQKEEQHLFVQQLIQNNLKAFAIHMTQKQKVSYEPSQPIKIDFGNQWYCYITDNQIQAKHTILTLHGAPGDHREWAGLEKQVGNEYRWINVTFPGFDGEDERRGNYDGSPQDFAKLLLLLLKKLSVSKIVLCAHSLGSIFGTYFITHYPQVVEGYINITGIVNLWYTGLLSFFQFSVSEYHFNNKEWRAQNVWGKDSFRFEQHQKFIQDTKFNTFGPVQFPRLTISEYFAYCKLISGFPNGLSQLYQLNSTLPIFQVLIFGKKDPLHEISKTEATIYHFCKNQTAFGNSDKFQKSLKLAKEPLLKKLKSKYNIDSIDTQKLQEYFMYHFDDTGHNAHKRRPKEMGRIINIYLSCIDVIEESLIAVKSRL